MRDIGSLIFETPICHNYEAGVEVRSLLSTEQLEEVDGRLAILDVDLASGTRFVKFWVDEVPIHASEESPSPSKERDSQIGEATDRDVGKRSPDFGGGIDFHDNDFADGEQMPLAGNTHGARERIPFLERSTPPRVEYPKTPPEDQIPRGCSLHSMEPLREWFCKGADMTSAAEYEAALV